MIIVKKINRLTLFQPKPVPLSKTLLKLLNSAAQLVFPFSTAAL